MKCPICQQYELVKQSLEDCGGDFPDTFCPEVVQIGNKQFNHYRQFSIMSRTRIIVLPYRILTDVDYQGVARTSVGVLREYKTGKPYFKTLLKLPELHPDTEVNLINRIKTLLLFS